MASTSAVFLCDAKLNEGGGRPEVVTLTNPKSNKPVKYIFSEKHVFEIQRATPKTPTSWIIDQNICSDGSMCIATRVDPLFLVMPLLESQQMKFSPLDQYLVNEKAPHARELQKCEHFDLSKLCDINDTMADMGPQYMLYRFSEEKTLQWLTKKVETLNKALLARRMAQSKISSQADGFCLPNSNPGQDEETKLSEIETGALCVIVCKNSFIAPARVKFQAAEMIGEYISQKWNTKLLKSLGLDAEALKKAAASGMAVVDEPATPKNKWDEQTSARDEMRAFTMGAPAAKKQKTAGGTAALSVKQKQLQKTNIKGMKSMMSFFKKAPTKKKI